MHAGTPPDEKDLLRRVSTGDEAAFKAQVGATGKACGNCHDDFRAK